jgi:regulator of sigma E protease
MSAGPAFNLIFPVFAYFFAMLGEQTHLMPRVGGVAPDMPAAIAGIKPGDLITRVNGMEIVRFEEISEAIAGVTSAIPITVKRGEQELTFQLDPVVTVDESNPIEKTRRGMLGISAQASAPVLGVPSGSVAEQAGLRSFDRIMSINGQATGDEVQLNQVLEKLSGTLTLQIVRLDTGSIGGAPFTTPKVSTVTLEKQPGESYAALGAEGSDLYIGHVLPGSAAARAGLKRGDRFVSVNDAVVKSYFLYNIKLKAQEDRPFKLTWQSGAELKTAQVQRKQEISYDDFKNERKTLVFGTAPFFSLVADPTPAETKTIQVGPQQALVLAVKEVPKAIRTIGLVIVKLFTGGVPLDAVGGPIAVFQVATKSAEAGLDTYLMNMALVSVNLGLVNLLPIPIFDGFALLAAFWEGIRRRPIPLRVREYANMFGLVVIAMLLVLVFKNDITKLFR